MPIIPALPPKRLVVIDDGLLASKAGNQILLAEFPFLNQIRQLSAGQPGGCSGCQGRAAEDPRTLILGNLKAIVASMGDAKKRRLKEMLNTQRVRLSYLSGTRVVQHEF